MGPVGRLYNISIDAFGEPYGDRKPGEAYGHLTISDAFETGLEPAPVTPQGDSAPWMLISGTVIGALETSDRKTYSGKKAIVAPGMSTGELRFAYYRETIYSNFIS